MARGVAVLFNHDLRLSIAHPPLINAICALPLLAFPDLKVPEMEEVLRDPRLDPEEKKFYFARLLLWTKEYGGWKGNADPLKIVFWCRVPVMLMSVALGLLIYVFTSRLLGPASGLAGLALYCFSPTILANAMLCTTDIGCALFIFIYALALDRHLSRPSWPTLLLCGAAFGLAQLTKFTAILLLPLTPVVLFLVQEGPLAGKLGKFFSLRARTPEFLTSALAALIIMMVGALVIFAGYGFELHSMYRIQAPALASLATPGLFLKTLAVKLLAAVPAPPRTYYYGLARTIMDTAEHSHPLYFLGRESPRGWWYYYPVLFAIKEPLGLLGLIALAALTFRKPPRLPRPAWHIALVFGVGMALAFMFLNRKNIGIRHLLPIYPFLFIWLSRLVSGRGLRGLLPYGAWALVAVCGLNSFFSFPDYLVHFNHLVGGPDGGLRYSVVGEDWGQDIMGLGRFCRERGITAVYYNPYGNVDARAYGVPAQKFECGERPPGWYAIHVVDLRRPKEDLPRDCYADFAAMKPKAVIHHTIYVYHLGPEEKRE